MGMSGKNSKNWKFQPRALQCVHSGKHSLTLPTGWAQNKSWEAYQQCAGNCSVSLKCLFKSCNVTMCGCQGRGQPIWRNSSSPLLTLSNVWQLNIKASAMQKKKNEANPRNTIQRGKKNYCGRKLRTSGKRRNRAKHKAGCVQPRVHTFGNQTQ